MIARAAMLRLYRQGAYNTLALCALGSCLILPAEAACPPGVIINGEVQATPQFIGSNVSCTVDVGGSIDSAGDQGIIAVDNATINNNGSISVGNSFGISADDNNIIVNTGSLSVIDSLGLLIRSSNTVVNTGSITVGVDYGIVAFHGNTITNSGSISVGGDWGMQTLSDNTITNSGSIAVGGHTGIFADDNSTITNRGSIVVGGDDGIRADFNATVTNSGTITVGGDRGISIGNTSTIVNSGAITAGGNFGIFALTSNTVINSGLIAALGGPGATAIEFAAGINTLTLLEGSRLIGLVDLAFGLDTVNLGRGENFAVTFSVGGGTPGLVNTFGAPSAILDGGRQVVTYDPSTSAATREGHAFAGLMGAVRDGLHYRLTSGNPTTYIWAQALASKTNVAGSAIDVPAQETARALTSGFSTPFGTWGRGGLFAGGATADRETINGGEDIRTDHGFGGAYARLFWGRLYADAIVTVGGLSRDSDRAIKNNLAATGIEYAHGSTDGWYVSPELTIGAELPIDSLIKIVPSVSVGYANLHLDRFTETGSIAAVAFSARHVEIWDGRVQLELRFKGDGATEAWKGALRGGYKTAIDTGDGVSGILAGTTSFAVEAADRESGAFVGGDLTYSPMQHLQLYAGGEATLDGKGLSTQGRVGASLKF
jgi:Autotransporter beta-domain